MDAETAAQLDLTVREDREKEVLGCQVTACLQAMGDIDLPTADLHRPGDLPKELTPASLV